MLIFVPSSSHGWMLIQPLLCECIVFSGSTRAPCLRISNRLGVHFRFQIFFGGTRNISNFGARMSPIFWGLDIHFGAVSGGQKWVQFWGQKWDPNLEPLLNYQKETNMGDHFGPPKIGPIPGPNFGPIFGSKSAKNRVLGGQSWETSLAPQECGSGLPE